MREAQRVEGDRASVDESIRASVDESIRASVDDINSRQC